MHHTFLSLKVNNNTKKFDLMCMCCVYVALCILSFMYCVLHAAQDQVVSSQKFHVAHSNIRDDCSEPVDLSIKNKSSESMSREIIYKCCLTTFVFKTKNSATSIYFSKGANSNTGSFVYMPCNSS